jgi:hypothetical protein
MFQSGIEKKIKEKRKEEKTRISNTNRLKKEDRMKKLFPIALVIAFLMFFSGCQIPGGGAAVEKITEAIEMMDEIQADLNEIEMQIDELTEAFNELSKAYDAHLEKYHKAKPVKIYIKKEITK